MQKSIEVGTALPLWHYEYDRVVEWRMPLFEGVVSSDYLIWSVLVIRDPWVTDWPL